MYNFRSGLSDFKIADLLENYIDNDEFSDPGLIVLAFIHNQLNAKSIFDYFQLHTFTTYLLELILQGGGEVIQPPPPSKSSHMCPIGPAVC